MIKRDLIICKSLVERATSADIRSTIEQKELFKPDDNEGVELKSKLKLCEKQKIQIITFLDKEYPKALKEIPDYPAVLYCRGDVKLLDEDGLVAMVGSRRATSYGLSVAKKFAAKLACAGAVIVSGMALGIDAASHRGALSVEGKTIAVLGTAIDYLYPRENEAIGLKIVKSGGLVVSEYPPGFWTSKFNFPMRNRIIAGLSRATIVVEAAQSSGALITADLALDYNRYLYAVPADIGKLSSQGTNMLLARGAICLSSPRMIIEDLNLSEKPENIRLSPRESKIIDAVKSGDDSFDKLINRLNLKSYELNVILAELEIKGVIKRSTDKIQTFD